LKKYFFPHHTQPLLPLEYLLPVEVAGIRDAVEISFHPPSLFITNHQGEILPDWKVPVASLAVVLQRSRLSLRDETPAVEVEKVKLRDTFLRFGNQFVTHLSDRGISADFFDPRNGYPLMSRPGSISCDCVAAIEALLGYAVVPGICSRIDHPRWGSAVYPGILAGATSPENLKAALLSAEPR